MGETKKCTQCGQEKPMEDFSKAYVKLCKDCAAEQERTKRKLKKAFDSSKDIPNNLNVLDTSDSCVFIPSVRINAAIAAMHGLLASGSYTTNSPDFIAQRSVIYADALLDELNKV